MDGQMVKLMDGDKNGWLVGWEKMSWLDGLEMDGRINGW